MRLAVAMGRHRAGSPYSSAAMRHKVSPFMTTRRFGSSGEPLARGLRRRCRGGDSPSLNWTSSVARTALQRNLDQFQVVRDLEIPDDVEPPTIFVPRR